MKGIASTKGEHGNLKQVFQEMLTTKAFRKGLKRWIALSAEKKKTPIYSALLGAALKSSCFIPKHLIE
jgi:hypothetical protein